MGKRNSSITDLNDLSKEELIARVKQLETHVKQLQDIIAKSNSATSSHQKVAAEKHPFDFSKYNKRHVALKLMYLGWNCQGFAVQEDTANTIESSLFQALLKTRLIESRETSNYHRCGRTDKGVSALGQVISIDLRSTAISGVGVKPHDGATAAGMDKSEIPYVRILNKVLPLHIRVLAWSPVASDFSARFDCIQRSYKYCFPKGDLNINAMNEAASLLLGEHDFRNLCKMDVGNGVTNYTRNISEAVIVELEASSEESGYRMHKLTVTGKAFLWHQIRCIMAVLFLVGQGKEKPDIVSQLLDVEHCPRKPQYSMASDFPLMLFDCNYEDLIWRYDRVEHVSNLQHLQELWTQHSVKALVIRQMLNYLENKDDLAAQAVRCQSVSLVQGHKSKVYKPLLQRHKCESLEDRIEHYVKRRKIERPQQTNNTNSQRETEVVSEDKDNIT